ncbi:MAG: four-carbon acid sugar kinase family protein [Spirochaetaceae bacterium]|nr:MAG: four-carbon acid sugar kinase family protein [Spirochaetaceae bacterium]
MRPAIRTRMVILADDFTGANDTTVQFAKRGYASAVSFDGTLPPQSLQRFDVLAIDTESRFDNARSAYDKVFAAVSQLQTHGVQHFYKKIDSTMRGNPGSEIAAALDASSARLAVVAPALPHHGRTTVGGRCLVHSQPLAETETARDPRTPVAHSSIADIMSTQCSYQITLINLEAVRRGPLPLQERLRRICAAAGPQLAVVDAETDHDLQIIAAGVWQLDQAVLPVGSSGLAQFLLPPKTSAAPVLIVVGSLSANAAVQIDHALQQRSELCELRLDPAAAVDAPQAEHSRLKQLYHNARSRGAPCLLRSPGGGDATHTCADSIARFIGHLVAAIVLSEPPGGLMLSGGDTAVKVAAALGCSGFSVETEALPGIPCGHFVLDHTARGNSAAVNQIPVVTKAGGFGADNAILRILDYLEERA